MRHISTRLLCIGIALSLFAGCGGTSGTSASGLDSPSPERTAQPTEETVPSVTEQVDNQSEEDKMSTIQIIVGDATFTAALYDNEAAKALSAMLPMTVDTSELNGNEKYCYLNEALPQESGIPDGIHTGDLMLFGADCLVLFYEDFSTTYKYTPLGRIDNPEGLAEALGSGSVTVTFQLAG